MVLIVSFTPKTAVLFPGGIVTFTCNSSENFWVVNETTSFIDDVEIERINGLSVVDGDNPMLIVTQSANNTLYGCGIFSGSFIVDTGILYVAGMYTYMHKNNHHYATNCAIALNSIRISHLPT